jgi:hypothetical protein
MMKREFGNQPTRKEARDDEWRNASLRDKRVCGHERAEKREA